MFGLSCRAIKFVISFLSSGAVVAALATVASAVDYPHRSVKVIVPFPAGGTADLMPRIVFEVLARKWRQSVVIENKAGAGGNVGADAAFHAEPDGYTLFSSPAPPFVINQNLYRRLGYDPAAFVPISVMGTVPTGLDNNGALLIHCLDIEQPVAAQLAAEEALLVQAIGGQTIGGARSNA